MTFLTNIGSLPGEYKVQKPRDVHNEYLFEPTKTLYIPDNQNYVA